MCGFAQAIAACHQLDATGAVLEIRERHPAHAPTGHEPARHLHALTQQRARLRRGVRALEGAGVRLDPRFAQPPELLTAVADDRGQVGVAQLTVRILTRLTPEGALHSTSSPALWPSSARPSGLSFEIRPCSGSASAGPTIA